MGRPKENKGSGRPRHPSPYPPRVKKQELKKLHTKVKEKGNSIVPLRLFINEKNKAKIEIALAKGKKIYDKRESIREKDIKRDINRSQILK